MQEPSRTLQASAGISRDPSGICKGPLGISRVSRSGPSRDLQGSLRFLVSHWKTQHVVNLMFETKVAETSVPAMFRTTVLNWTELN